MKIPWSVVDLFSGAGGMSYGFHAHPNFRLVGAVDAQIGKPSSGKGTLECNATYEANIGIRPLEQDLAEVDFKSVLEQLRGSRNKDITVLASCAPCTGFSRTVNANHLRDDPRNSLVTRSAEFVKQCQPQIFLMENARELIRGNFSHHFRQLENSLKRMGYDVVGEVHKLSAFGLPQVRERAIVIAVRDGLSVRTLNELWEGYEIPASFLTVRHAIGKLPALQSGEVDKSDPMHCCPKLGEENSRRLAAIPADGGSWIDLVGKKRTERLLTPAMLRYAENGDFGSHPDVYGRLAWDRPAPTIKRECGHIGNGRYAHPVQNRLCSVRELATLQGFPSTFQFAGRSLANRYRHLGDAVPPFISHQLAALCKWILTGRRPAVAEFILSQTHVTPDAVRSCKRSELFA